ncbi:gelsolin-related protein of 125 kDa-like [Palaemon carinicauda]|uniref:gelsolin-related protein of 125 kDa-like n=1 Tax=Palaemon carinicauda TaxID=392227 RepID=UPI0035B64B39
MAQEKNDVQNQIESALVKEKETLKQELEDIVTLDEEKTMKIFQLNEELEKAKEKIEAQDELKSILLAENEDLKKSNEERNFLDEELALEKIKLENGLMEARANDQKRIVRMTNLEDQMKKELSAAKDVISSLKKELQKRDLENVIKKEGMGEVERCETAAEDDKKVLVVKEEKQGQDGPTRKRLYSTLGMAGFGLRFCPNSSEVAAPRINLPNLKIESGPKIVNVHL